MNEEAQKLYARLQEAQKHLMSAKLTLEQVRQLGVEAEQNVVALKNEVHTIKDQLAALAGKETP